MSVFEVGYETLLNYSPRGTQATSVLSREICYGVKNDRADIIKKAVGVAALRKAAQELFQEVDARSAVLVPVPRSAPLRPGALWPAHRICEELIRYDLAHEVLPCLTRTSPVQRSSSATEGQRPSIKDHLNTLHCSEPPDMLPRELVVVDDVLTRGATALACAMWLKRSLPNASISVFCLVNTQKGLDAEVDKIVMPGRGTLTRRGSKIHRTQ